MSPRNPLFCKFTEGSWVRCRYGLYRDDVGIVCGHDPSTEASVIVALVPRIPLKSAETTKWKKGAQPAPRIWSPRQMALEWGVSRVRTISAHLCEFFGETYNAGLLIKHLSPANLDDAVAPASLVPFVQASCIREMPSFGQMICQHAQDTIRINQRVRVVREEQRGLIGLVFDIDFDQATVVPEDDTPALLVPVRNLEPVYRAGDKVKSRWFESCGLVTSVDERNN